MSLKNGLLGLLSLREMSGYEIKRHFDRAVHFVWNAADSQIYRELRDLEKSGLIESRLVQQDGKPNKRLYQLTDAGNDALHAWLASPAEPPNDKEAFLMRLFFMGQVPNDTAVEVLEQRCQELRKLLAVGAERMATYSDLTRTERAGILWWQLRLIEGLERIHTAQLEWLEGIIEEIRSSAPARVSGTSQG